MTLLDKLIKLRARVSKMVNKYPASDRAEGFSDAADKILYLVDLIIEEECVLADEHG
jgi:hypothetical protein